MESRALLVLVAVFGLGALVLYLIGRSPSRRALAEELWRLFFLEIAIVGFVLVPAYAGPRVFTVAMLVLGLRTQAELLEAWAPRATAAERGLAAALGVLALALAPWASDTVPWRAAVALAMVCLVADLLRAPSPIHLEAPLRTLVTVVYPPMFLGSLLALRARPEGFVLVAFLYTAVETCDSFALLAGKALGSGRPFPVLSPGKTWAGLVGGLLAGALVGTWFGLVATRLAPAAVLAATAVALAATVLGDLVASKIKRNSGLKDFGGRPTPHGGILDIYDSLVFAAPLFHWTLDALVPGR